MTGSEAFPSAPWPLVPLGDLCLPKRSVNPGKSPSVPIRYIDISSINNTSFSVTGHTEYLGAEAPSRARQPVSGGDVLFATTRPYLRNVALVPATYDGAICSTGFCVLRANGGATAEWLYALARSEGLMRQVVPRMRGANYPAVSDKDVLAALVPKPPLDEQRRIVARIDEAMARVTELRGLREDTEARSAALPSALRHDWWEGLCSRYGTAPLRSAVFSSKNGLYKPREFHGSGTALLRMYNIRGGDLDLSQVKRLEVTPAEADQFEVKKGDILMSRVNSRELVGKSAFVPELSEPAVFEAMIIRLRPRSGMDPFFLAQMLNAPQFLHDLRMKAKHAIGQSSVNQNDVLSSLIPMPPTDVQRGLARRWRGLLDASRHLAQEIPDHEALNALPSAILRKAFAGEL